MASNLPNDVKSAINELMDRLLRTAGGGATAMGVDWGGLWDQDVNNTFPILGSLTLGVSVSGKDGSSVSRPWHDMQNGGDFSSVPYLTLSGLLSDVPRHLSADLLVNLGAGTFVGAEVAGFLGGAGVYITGTVGRVTPTTGVNNGTAGLGTSSTSLVKPTGAANWTASDTALVGNLVHVIAGGGSSSDPRVIVVRPIKAVTTTTITVDAVAGMDHTTQFEIVHPTTLLSAISNADETALRVTGNAASVSFRLLRFSGASLDYLVNVLNNSSTVTCEGCIFDVAAALMEFMATNCQGLTLKNCTFINGTAASISNMRSVIVTNVWQKAAGTLTISDSALATVRGLESLNAVSRVLGALRVASMSAEVKAVSGGATPVYLEDVDSFTAAGANLLTGASNTGYGLEIAKSGRYTLTGSDITGGSGDLLFFGNAVSWSLLNNPAYGIAEEHSGSAIVSSSYTKALVYGDRTFMGNIDVSGRALHFGYLNLAANTSVPTLTGTQSLDMEAGTIDGSPGGLGGNPRGVLEVICSSALAQVVLPSNFAIAGGFCVIVNRGGSNLTVVAPSPGTINGLSSVTVNAGKSQMFLSLNGNGGKDFWTLT